MPALSNLRAGHGCCCVIHAAYEIWLAVHSLILDEDKASQKGEAHPSVQAEQMEEIEQAERCRMAIVAAMVLLAKFITGDERGLRFSVAYCIPVKESAGEGDG